MIQLYYQNVRGLRSKTVEFFNNILCNNFDVIVLSETWLNGSVFDSELFDKRYVVYRRDRETSGFHPKKDAGGVLIAVSKLIPSRRLQALESNCEDLWVRLDYHDDVTGKTEQLLICAVYLPPPVKRHILSEFINNSDGVLERNSDNRVIFVGDFNLGSTNWNFNSKSEPPTATNNSLFSTMLKDFATLHDLKQYNDKSNNKGRILDLVLSNTQVTNLNVSGDSLVPVDPLHPPLIFSLSLNAANSLSYNYNARYCFHKADYDKIISDLNAIPWEDELESCSDIDEMVSIFYRYLRNIIQKHVPKSKPKSKKYPIWFSRNLVSLLKEKLKYRNKLRKFNKNPLDLLSFELLKERSERLKAACYRNYIGYLEQSLRDNPKVFWSFVKHKRSNDSHYPAQMTLDNRTATNGFDICNLFADNFSSAYNNNGRIQPTAPSAPIASPTNNFLTSIKFKDDQVLKVLKRLDIHKGAGSDGIPSIFVAKCATALAKPLTVIYNKSLTTGLFPSEWKIALIVPLLKTGAKELIKNYRPISILSVFAKAFEQLLNPILSWHFKQLFDSHQHGFMNGRSTATNLTSFIDNVSHILDNRSSVDAIYTDFSKAFDRVNHDILLRKLNILGIDEPMLSWFRSYLLGRTSKVVVNGYSSNPFPVGSGVPQGSHLAPLLFNIFINDIGRCFANSRYLLFADDLKFYRVVDSAADASLLQADLCRLIEWCDENGMNLNASKCSCMHFSRKKNNTYYHYSINGDTLTDVDTVKDLGVWLDNKLRLNTHIDKICSKGFKNLGFVLRNCKDFKSPKTKILLFNSFVRSGLEYCSVVWNPFYDIYKKRLESIQKRFLWHLTYSCNLAKTLLKYDERLNYFKILPLSDRRRLLDLMFLYKLANGNLEAPELLETLTFSTPFKLPRASRYKLLVNCSSRTNVGHHAPLNRLVREFNSLSKTKDLDLFTVGIRKFRKSLI